MAVMKGRKCQCVELNHYLHHPKVLESDFGGVKCGPCLDSLLEEKNALVRENLTLRKQLEGRNDG